MGAKKTYRILSMDGGAMTPTYSRLVRELEEAHPGLLAKTDMFAGTADGCFSALYLASREDLSHGEVGQDWVDYADEVFRSLQPEGGADAMREFVIGKSVLEYNDQVRAVLEAYIDPDTTIGDLERGFCAATFSIGDGYGSREWTTLDPAEADYSAIEVTLQSGATPMFLPIFQGHGVADKAVPKAVQSTLRKAAPR